MMAAPPKHPHFSYNLGWYFKPSEEPAMKETVQQYVQRIQAKIAGKDPLRTQTETAKRLAGLLKRGTPAKLKNRPAPDKSRGCGRRYLRQHETVAGFRRQNRASRVWRLYSQTTEDRNRSKPEDWSRQIELQLAAGPRQATVRKLIGHVLIHEIRHWAQLARIMRERGFEPPGGHDLLMSGALE